MPKVVAIMSMSLDGYIADFNDGVAEVFEVSGPSAEHLRGLWSELGGVLTGRRTFDVAQGWGPPPGSPLGSTALTSSSSA